MFMRHIKMTNKVIGLALAALTFTACTETWNDHYEGTTDVGAWADKTLWEAIKADGSLNNFVRVAEATGYDRSLNSSQMFTVFAPTDDTFSSSEADQLISQYNTEKANGVKDEDNTTIKTFLRNHIALYSHSVSGTSSDSIVMMNGKYALLTNDKIGHSELTLKNRLCSNGLLYKVATPVTYFNNVFEYLRTDADLDSLANFLYTYNEYEFMPDQSVAGGINDKGETEYLDSVTVLKNELFDYLGLLNSEDSTYWVVAPTNDVWSRLISEYNTYFNYADNVDKRDSLQYVASRMAIVQGTIFSRTQNRDAAVRDSAMSTAAATYQNRLYAWGSRDFKYYQYEFPFNPGGVFDGTDNIECSNGEVRKAANWNINKNQTFMRTLIVEAETRDNLKEVNEQTTKSPLTSTEVLSSSAFYNKVSRNTFALVEPTTASVNAEVTFYLPNVLSNVKYDIYAVMVPALAADTLATEAQRLPTKLRFTIYYENQQGRERSENLKNPLDGTNDYVTTPDVIDTLLVAQNYEFETCGYGLTMSPVKLKVKTQIGAKENTTYTRTMRIDCFILKPHEDD